MPIFKFVKDVLFWVILKILIDFFNKVHKWINETELKSIFC